MAENTLSVLKIAPGQHPQQVEIWQRQNRTVLLGGSTNFTSWLPVIYALSDFLIMILSWLVKQLLRAFLYQEVQP